VGGGSRKGPIAIDPGFLRDGLNVADWTLPDVADRVSLFNLYQSPDALAEYYKVAPWSAEHWRLIERSLKLMGMPADCQPPPAHLQMFRRAAPEYGWMHESHMRIAGFRHGGRDEVIPVTYQSMVYTNPIPDPRRMRCRGWRHSGEPAAAMKHSSK